MLYRGLSFATGTCDFIDFREVLAADFKIKHNANIITQAKSQRHNTHFSRPEQENIQSVSSKRKTLKFQGKPSHNEALRLTRKINYLKHGQSMSPQT